MWVMTIRAGDMPLHERGILVRVMDPLAGFDGMTKWLGEFRLDILRGDRAAVADGAGRGLHRLGQQPLRMAGRVRTMATEAGIFRDRGERGRGPGIDSGAVPCGA